MIVGMRHDGDERALAAVKIGERGEREIEQHVAVDEEAFTFDWRKRRETPGGAEQLGLDADVELEPQGAGLLAEGGGEMVAEMAGEHGQALDSLAPQHAHLAKDDRHAADRQQRLRDAVARHAAGASAEAAGDDDGVHGKTHAWRMSLSANRCPLRRDMR